MLWANLLSHLNNNLKKCLISRIIRGNNGIKSQPLHQRKRKKGSIEANMRQNSKHF